jgi:nitrite reductase (NO-forming)
MTKSNEIGARMVAVAMLSLPVMLLAIIFLQLRTVTPMASMPAMMPAMNGAAPADTGAPESVPQPVVAAGQDVVFTVKTILGGDPAMAFVGVGGEIDGVVNPELHVKVGDKVTIHVINGDPVAHDLTIDEYGMTTGELSLAGQEGMIQFTATQPGTFDYYCSIPGHRQAGMVGKLVVEGDLPAQAGGLGVSTTQGGEYAAAVVAPPAPADPNAVSIVRNPADVPPPIGDREPMTFRVDLTTQEVTGQLADGTTYNYFTFDGKVPGPMIRMQIGDTVELALQNDSTSKFPHSIDLHAVTGPGGGAVYTQTKPGEETTFVFRALNPGLYVYHCATASIPHHISNGMYGLILVEPEGGLPPVDREFYVMQGEIYTEQPFGTAGHLAFSPEHMSNEIADYVIFNGAAGALTSDENALRANVGETVRIYFGVGGPNYTSSFHVIGEIFDRVYDQASLTAAPLTDVQTTLVPPGGATMVEFKVDVPGRYILVDHALSRLERGLAGFLLVEGADDPTIYHSDGSASMEGH